MKKLSLFLLPIVTLLSCSDFIEYPLEGKTISLLSPKDNYITRDSIITFWWDTHEDAKFYRLQIIEPSFDEAKKIIADSVTVKNKVEIKLKANKYQWRVRPENDGSVGSFSVVRNLEIR